VPGDKSISHRALIFHALADGNATIEGLLESEDVRSTAACLKALGVQYEGGRIEGRNGQLHAPADVLDCGNSGTTIRLLMGLLAGQPITAKLTGDASLRSRPMQRVTDPLSRMGVEFIGDSLRPPIQMKGGGTRNIRYRSSVASAQVKTALMLAAVQSEGTLEFEEPSASRDHTERMFRAMGVEFVDEIAEDGTHRIVLAGPQRLHAQCIDVPGDVSSAAFFLVGASILPGSDLTIRNVGVNPTRSGVVQALKRMGANIEEVGLREVSGEPVADLRVQKAALTSTVIEGAEIPLLVDELPVLAVAAAHAEGTTIVRNAGELRVKESDRIEATANIIRSMGADIEVRADGFSVHGRPRANYRNFEISAEGDHRIAMASCIAALATSGVTTVHGAESIRTSFPEFLPSLEALRG